MRTKKVLSTGLITILLVSMAMLMTPIPTGQAIEHHNAQALWLDPNFTDTLTVCESFTVSLMLNISAPTPGGGTGLYGWEYKLYWETAWLSLTSYKTTIKPIPVPPYINETVLGWDTDVYLSQDSLGNNGTHGFHWYAVAALAPAPAFTGVSWICNYTFHVDNAPYQPSPAYTGPFPFWVESFYDDKVAEIFPPGLFWMVIGHYRIHAIEAPKPRLEVRPKKTQGVCSQKFNISIAIYNLVKEWNLWGWEAKLKYNPAYLEAQASFEGPFLPSFVSPPHVNATSYINILNYTANTILTAGSFNDHNHTAPECKNAYGVLSILEFNASVQTIAPELVSTTFELLDIKLVGVYPNNTLYSIPMTTPPMVNGTYNVPYKVVGWFLDCYTDLFRKKCIAAHSGEGINQTADPYEPQDLVILHSYLEYNYEPEAYKLVTFEIHGPPNAVKNITIYRTAYTNASGVATINFTIPGSGVPNWQEMVFGHWECYQAAQVKIYEKPSDWLYWKVGWIIEILNVTVWTPRGIDLQGGVKKCEEIKIQIDFKTIAFIPKNVTFTITVLDELLDPIQWEFWVVLVEPTEYYLCSERLDQVNTTSHIPQWAHVGKATVFVNAFTDLPTNCGCPYCPEVTQEFWIIKTADP